MFLEMACGVCDSSVQIDSAWEESVWLMAHRFSNGHVKCGTYTDDVELPTRPAYLDAVDDEGSGDEEVA